MKFLLEPAEDRALSASLMRAEIIEIICFLHSYRLRRRSTTSSTPCCTWCLCTFSGKEVGARVSPFTSTATMKYLSHWQPCRVIIAWRPLSLDGFLNDIWVAGGTCFSLSVRPGWLSLLMSALQSSVYSKQTSVAACCVTFSFSSIICYGDLHAAAEQMSTSLKWEESHVFSMFSKGPQTFRRSLCVYVGEGSHSSWGDGAKIWPPQVKNAAFLTFGYNQQHSKLSSIYEIQTAGLYKQYKGMSVCVALLCWDALTLFSSWVVQSQVDSLKYASSRLGLQCASRCANKHEICFVSWMSGNITLTSVFTNSHWR